jgi:hypothetical protein
MTKAAAHLIIACDKRKAFAQRRRERRSNPEFIRVKLSSPGIAVRRTASLPLACAR